MEKDNAFDRYIEKNAAKMPAGLEQSANIVSANMDMAWLAAQAIFKDQATPEAAIAIYDRFIAQLSQTPGQSTHQG